MADSDSHVRKHGLESPLNGLQIFTWLLFPILILLYVLTVFCVMPTSESSSSSSPNDDELPAAGLDILWYNQPRTGLAINSFFFASLLLFGLSGLYNGYLVSSIDPIDPFLSTHLALTTPAASAPSPEKQFCWICQVHVSLSAIHCRHCGKCVSGFDHHCLWLNTCVGKANYRYFWNTVVSVTGFAAVQTIGASWMLGFYWSSKGWSIEPRAIEIFGTYENWGIVLHVYLFFLLVTLVMLLQLFFFHLNLRRTGQTTYNFIIADHKRIRAKERLETKRLAERKERRNKRIEVDKASGFDVTVEEIKEDCGIFFCGGGGRQGEGGGGGGENTTDSCCPGRGAVSKNKKKKKTAAAAAGAAAVQDAATASTSSSSSSSSSSTSGSQPNATGRNDDDEDNEYDDEEDDDDDDDDVPGGDIEIGGAKKTQQRKPVTNNRPGGGEAYRQHRRTTTTLC